MKKIFLLLAFLLGFSSVPATAIDLKFVDKVKTDFTGKYTVRGRFDGEDDTRARLQQRVVLKFKARFDGGVELIAVGASGSAFNSGFETPVDSDREDKVDDVEEVITNFRVRNLFVQKKFESNLVLQVGALTNDKNLKQSTSLDGLGYVDGVRLKKDTSYGDVQVTAGSIIDDSEVNIFERDFDVNYFEVTLNKNLFDNIVAEFGYEYHDGDNFLTIAHKQKLALASDKILTVVSEALVNVDQSAIKASVGVKADFIQYITGRNSGVSFDARINYNDQEDIGARGTSFNGGFSTSDDVYLTLVANFSLSAIAEKINLNISDNYKARCRYRHNLDSDIDDRRLECEVSYVW